MTNQQRQSFIAVTAALSAAISLLVKGGNAAKKAAPSDTMFDLMLEDYRKALADARAALSTEAQPEVTLGLAEYEALKKAAELLSVAVELEKARLDLSEIPDDEINNRPQAKMQLRKHASNWFGNALKLLEDIDAARTGKPNARV